MSVIGKKRMHEMTRAELEEAYGPEWYLRGTWYCPRCGMLCGTDPDNPGVSPVDGLPWTEGSHCQSCRRKAHAESWRNVRNLRETDLLGELE